MIVLVNNEDGKFEKVKKMITKFKISLKGIEPVFYWQTKKGDYIKTVTVGLFYPFRRIKCFIYDYKLKIRFKQFGYPVIKCQGCGDGWVEWKTLEPNNKKGWIKVCAHCVNFYDIDFTRKRLEVNKK